MSFCTRIVDEEMKNFQEMKIIFKKSNAIFSNKDYKWK